jgi:hypothetical protein
MSETPNNDTGTMVEPEPERHPVTKFNDDVTIQTQTTNTPSTPSFTRAFSQLTLCDAMTAEYMMNRTQYDKLMRHENEEDMHAEFRKDRRFYKKRIFALTRDLFNKKTRDVEIVAPFNAYIKECIKYLKFKDMSDIIQMEHAEQPAEVDDDGFDGGMTTDYATDFCAVGDGDEEKEKGDGVDIISRANEYCMKQSPEVKRISLDNYVVVQTPSSDDHPQLIIPKRKEINLRDPSFKTKGLKQKRR